MRRSGGPGGGASISWLFADNALSLPLGVASAGGGGGGGGGAAAAAGGAALGGVERQPGVHLSPRSTREDSGQSSLDIVCVVDCGCW